MSPLDADIRALERLTPAQLHAYAERYFKSGSAIAPEVALIVYDGVHAIFKDYGHTRGWFAWLVAPILLWREASALEQLAGLNGIPRLYRRIDRRGLLLEYLPAEAWPRANAPNAAYLRLDRLVAQMHAAGIAHCDLRAASNMLVADNGTPYIVDFVARIRRGRPVNLPWNWLFDQFVRADRSALAKLRARHAQWLLTDADHELLKHRGLSEHFARAVGARTRRLVRFFAR